MSNIQINVGDCYLVSHLFSLSPKSQPIREIALVTSKEPDIDTKRRTTEYVITVEFISLSDGNFRFNRFTSSGLDDFLSRSLPADPSLFHKVKNARDTYLNALRSINDQLKDDFFFIPSRKRSSPSSQ